MSAGWWKKHLQAGYSHLTSSSARLMWMWTGKGGSRKVLGPEVAQVGGGLVCTR